jgi:hypothetical protein
MCCAPHLHVSCIPNPRPFSGNEETGRLTGQFSLSSRKYDWRTPTLHLGIDDYIEKPLTILLSKLMIADAQQTPLKIARLSRIFELQDQRHPTETSPSASSLYRPLATVVLRVTVGGTVALL